MAIARWTHCVTRAKRRKRTRLFLCSCHRGQIIAKQNEKTNCRLHQAGQDRAASSLQQYHVCWHHPSGSTPEESQCQTRRGGVCGRVVMPLSNVSTCSNTSGRTLLQSLGKSPPVHTVISHKINYRATLWCSTTKSGGCHRGRTCEKLPQSRISPFLLLLRLLHS